MAWNRTPFLAYILLYLRDMKRGKPNRIDHLVRMALCLATLLALGWAPFAMAASPGGKAEGETRQQVLWNQPVNYQFSVTENPNLSYDGEAYQKMIEGKIVNFVMMNKVFFEREAKDLFRRLNQNDKTQDIKPLESEILSLNLVSGKTAKINEKTKATLKNLNAALELLAWRELHRESLNSTPSEDAAEKLFIEKFTQSRMKTIEYHEVAHLLDLARDANRETPQFEKFSELNAFYTELAYGDNPLDTVAQAVTGLIDELNRGKMVDYSTDKIGSILRFFNSNLGILATLEKSQLKDAGRNLYQKNQDSSPTQIAIKP